MINRFLTKLIPLFVIAFGLILSSYWLAKALPDLIDLSFSRISGHLSIAATYKLYILIGVVIFILVILLKYVPESLERSTPSHFTQTNAYFTGMFLILFIFAFSIIFVDPRAVYGTNRFEPRVNPSRSYKVDAFSKLDYLPNLVVFGSSRAFTISPEYIENQTGLTAFNWAVYSGTIEDTLTQLHYIIHHYDEKLPEVLLIEIFTPLGVSPQVTAFNSPPELIPFMRPLTIVFAVQYRILELFNVNELTEALYVFRYSQEFEGKPLPDWEFTESGMGTTNYLNYEERLNAVINYFPDLQRCNHLFIQGLAVLDELIQLAEDYKSSIVFYIGPFASDYYNTAMKTDSEIINCMEIHHQYFQSLSESHSNVFYLDFSRVENFNGLDNKAGFYDHAHLNPANSELLIDAMKDTLLEAYQHAVELRKQPTK